MNACKRCGKRWAQARGLCRTCQRETGADNRTTFERERDRLACAATSEATVMCRVVTEQERREVVIRGISYEVVWDGTVHSST